MLFQSVFEYIQRLSFFYIPGSSFQVLVPAYAMDLCPIQLKALFNWKSSKSEDLVL